MRRIGAPLLLATFLVSSCGGAAPEAAPAAPKAPSTSPSEPVGPALSLEAYREQANALCRAATAEAGTLTAPTSESSKAEVDAFLADVFAKSDRLLADLRALRPPAEAEQEIRSQFIQPLTSQLGFAKQALGAPPGKSEEFKALAADAQGRAQSYANSNGLADCAK